ncbi:MAG: hypothetical protein ACK40M_10630 [Flavobacteriales bacterium]
MLLVFIISCGDSRIKNNSGSKDLVEMIDLNCTGEIISDSSIYGSKYEIVINDQDSMMINSFHVPYYFSSSLKDKINNDTVQVELNPSKHIILGQELEELWYVNKCDQYKYLNNLYIKVKKNSNYHKLREEMKYDKLIWAKIVLSFENDKLILQIID